MPSGIPVATVAIDGAQNAAILAAEILSVADDELAKKLHAAREAGAEKVRRANARIEETYNH
jgi:5-(carboxyamino)imidazole ribonucleotide mutase